MNFHKELKLNNLLFLEYTFALLCVDKILITLCVTMATVARFYRLDLAQDITLSSRVKISGILGLFFVKPVLISSN